MFGGMSLETGGGQKLTKELILFGVKRILPRLQSQDMNNQNCAKVFSSVF